MMSALLLVLLDQRLVDLCALPPVLLAGKLLDELLLGAPKLSQLLRPAAGTAVSNVLLEHDLVGFGGLGVHAVPGALAFVRVAAELQEVLDGHAALLQRPAQELPQRRARILLVNGLEAHRGNARARGENVLVQDLGVLRGRAVHDDGHRQLLQALVQLPQHRLAPVVPQELALGRGQLRAESHGQAQGLDLVERPEEAVEA
mmetsp:Transcript_24458/g.76196  ORF Transcript_24458/g.76196 Transcript_24458/m.76196 type:complete len:202 (-) Transcript_24458:213-818(-)